MTVERETVQALNPGDTGRWLITTQGSQHVLDLDQGTYRRFAGSNRPVFDFDNQVHTFTALEQWPQVGQCMRVVYDDPHSPLIEQWRRSSTIRRIEKLNPDVTEHR